MMSQRVERTWICTGGYGQFRGEWVKDVHLIFYICSSVFSWLFIYSAARTVGVFWMNAAETWVDISSSNARKVTSKSSNNNIVFCALYLQYFIIKKL